MNRISRTDKETPYAYGMASEETVCRNADAEKAGFFVVSIIRKRRFFRDPVSFGNRFCMRIFREREIVCGGL